MRFFFWDGIPEQRITGKKKTRHQERVKRIKPFVCLSLGLGFYFLLLPIIPGIKIYDPFNSIFVSKTTKI